MSAVEVLGELAARSLRLTLEGVEGLLAGPKSKVTEVDRELIRANRAELLEHLQAGETPEQRCERLDRERNAADKLRGRGYDNNCGSFSHREFLARTGKDCPCLHRAQPGGGQNVSG